MSIEPISNNVMIIISLIGAIVGLLSVIFVGIQLWQKVRSDHAKYVAEMMDKTRSNPVMLELFTMLDYQKFKYDIDFHDSEIERVVDNLLHHYEYILYLKERRMINKAEFRFFEYNIQRMIENSEMQNYLFNLHHFKKYYNLSFKYERLLEYGMKNKFIDYEEFNKKDSCEYKKVLPF